MIKVFNKYSYIFFFYFIGIKALWAVQIDPPPPDFDPGIPPPVGLPINDGVVVLFVIAVCFGFYKIYYSTIKKKGSI